MAEHKPRHRSRPSWFSPFAKEVIGFRQKRFNDDDAIKDGLFVDASTFAGTEQKVTEEQIEEIWKRVHAGSLPEEDHPLNQDVNLNIHYIKSEEELVGFIKLAANDPNKKKIRIHGSGHSFPESLGSSVEDAIIVSLAQCKDFLTIEINEELKTVRAGCGVKLGGIPTNGYSLETQEEESLIYALEQVGLALPNIPGVTHQSLGGMMTGSDGGSTRHSFSTSVIGLRFIDGSGVPHEVQHPDYGDEENADLFWAVGISMGLFGVITHVTLQLKDRFTIVGTEVICPVNECKQLDLFADKSEGELMNLEDLLQSKDFTRVIYQPQTDPGKVMMYTANIQAYEDDNDPYENVSWPIQLVYNGIVKTMISPLKDPGFSSFQQRILRTMYNIGTPTEVQSFRDEWPGLAMDNEMRDDCFPTQFTELWFPLDQTSRVMEALKKYFDGDENFLRKGFNVWEFYTGKKSEFWLHPAYGRNSFRIDVFFFWRKNDPDPVAFYNRFWTFLEEEGLTDYRYHWGKWHHANSWEFTQSKYERIGDWLALRNKYDPNNVFLTKYWEEHLVGKH